MTYFSKDIIIKIVTTYLKLTSRNKNVRIEEISKEALVEKSIVEAFLKSYSLDSEPTSSKRVKATLIALSQGVEGDRIARYLTWREFEELSAELFKEAGYTVFRDIRIPLRRRIYQIDLIALMESVLLVVDCKHWAKPPAHSERRKIISMQEERIRALTSFNGEVEVRVIPVVLTLYEPRELIVEGYPYVPIRKIKGFLEWFKDNYLFIKHIKTCISLEKLKSLHR
ncbi:MAG: NERD domain-containing protein [Aigarchaeota archaeon]|nr:NERD domain-containing protein [Aigarchaeota archaeon]MCX8192951.1 NERD domain-containing protein [Nitrososphaeria archaeon]MDW7986404.1 nuclease-related domain-containing protein [Nitrososphaerota archaeon]